VPEPVNLWRNENHHGPSDAVMAAFHAITKETLREYARSSPLKQLLSREFGIHPAAIVLGQGAEDILTHTLQVLVKPGDRVLIPSASWHYYRTLIRRVRGMIVEYPVVENGLDWVTDVDALIAEHHANPTKVILLTTVSNPTGALFPHDRLEEILDACPDAVVVVDDAYGDFRFDLPPSWLVSLTLQYPNLIVIRSQSKLHSLAGMRIGYGVFGAGTAEVGDTMVRSLGHNRVAESLAVAAQLDVSFNDKVRKTIAADRDRLSEALSLWPQVKVYRSWANFQLIRFYSVAVPEVVAALDADQLIVKWWTGDAAEAEPVFANCARISVGTTEEHDRVRLAITAGLLKVYGRPLPRTWHRGDLTDVYCLFGPLVRRPTS
jgi:histidinol-phosphate aminotransferase